VDDDSNVTDGISLLIWTAGALLGLVTAAFLGVALAPAFVFHRRPSFARRTDRSFIRDGRVFCRAQGSDIDVDACVGCAHLRELDGGGAFIVCDGRAAATISVDL
jgi:hypothetical protein